MVRAVDGVSFTLERGKTISIVEESGSGKTVLSRSIMRLPRPHDVRAAGVIVIEGTLSFVGLSVQLPKPTWGTMINEDRVEIRQTILPVLWPSLALTGTVLALNQMGNWLQARRSVRSSAP
jgi:ABC-type oligopeptide transport system ATPase subunit